MVAFAGLGGQGVLSAARLLGEAAFRRGVPVTVSQLHGMSQRGGAVEATVCFHGPHTLAPGSRHVDVLVGLELLEALRLAARLGPGSVAVVNRWLLPPPGAVLARVPIPSEEEVLGALGARAAALHVLDVNALADQAGARPAANAVVLGVVCALGVVPVDSDDLLEAIRRLGAPETRAINERAFALGCNSVSRAAAARADR